MADEHDINMYNRKDVLYAVSQTEKICAQLLVAYSRYVFKGCEISVVTGSGDAAGRWIDGESLGGEK